jgi:hypothetical protein
MQKFVKNDRLIARFEIPKEKDGITPLLFWLRFSALQGYLHRHQVLVIDTILANQIPNNTNKTHRTLFKIIFITAYLIFPFNKKLAVSSEYAENVV